MPLPMRFFISILSDYQIYLSLMNDVILYMLLLVKKVIINENFIFEVDEVG